MAIVGVFNLNIGCDPAMTKKTKPAEVKRTKPAITNNTVK